MKKPLIIKSDRSITISYNGRKLVTPINKHNEHMTNDEIINQYIKVRNIKNNRV